MSALTSADFRVRFYSHVVLLHLALPLRVGAGLSGWAPGRQLRRDSLRYEFLIDSLKVGTPPHLKLRNWIQAGENLDISTVAWGELPCGPLASADLAVAQTLFPRQESLLGADAMQAAHPEESPADFWHGVRCAPIAFSLTPIKVARDASANFLSCNSCW